MSTPNVIPVEIKGIIPSNAGSGVFLGNDDKVFVIYVERQAGHSIDMFMRGMPKERPQTHDLMASLMLACGAKIDRVIINDQDEHVFFARIIITEENEIRERKIIELDGRPSDSLAMATQQKAPIYVAQHVWDSVEDMSEVLQGMLAGKTEDTLNPFSNPLHLDDLPHETSDSWEDFDTEEDSDEFS